MSWILKLSNKAQSFLIIGLHARYKCLVKFCSEKSTHLKTLYVTNHMIDLNWKINIVNLELLSTQQTCFSLVAYSRCVHEKDAEHNQNGWIWDQRSVN